MDFNIRSQLETPQIKKNKCFISEKVCYGLLNFSPSVVSNFLV